MELKNKLIEVLKEQGFKINPHVRPAGYSKTIYRRLQQKARLEQLYLHKKFLVDSIKKVKNYCRDGSEIIPEDISLELREVQSGSFEEILFRWWNLIWWSIPFQRPYGRQMRFLLWDTTHNAPFGLICLQSPVLKMSVRDNYLDIPKDELDIWVNMSMQAHRVGALPPYNEILGGKMVALSLTCNEIREAYRRKYENYISIIKGRRLKPELLFITTTSAFGKSSLYNRLKYNGEIAAVSLGYTQGSGTFHIPEELYQEILWFLSKKGVDITRGYGHGSSRKLKLISLGLKYLGLSKFEYHGIKREFYLFPLVKNLKEIIHDGEKPIWVDRPFEKLVDYWKERWAIPRAERMPEWKKFDKEAYFKKIKILLDKW
ncbi:Druantia anti-phage system protein DruA [Caldisericum sp.]|uniref:Druantia anti-phage system protein DruA n=1 Tax=Caldisericum sp. TaxID=2499687 RepID=UPI003D097B13